MTGIETDICISLLLVPDLLLPLVVARVAD
jgi:hypothetical protein